MNPDRALWNLRDVAVDVLDEAGGDRHEALKLGQARMREFLSENPARAIDVVMPILSNKLWDEIRDLAPDGRPKIAHPPGPNDLRTRHDIRVGIRALGHDYLYAFLLPGGQKLGDSTRDNVDRARRAFAGTAQESTRNALWLAAIAREMSNGKTVKETFTQERLAKMLKGARDAAAITLQPKAKELDTR